MISEARAAALEEIAALVARAGDGARVAIDGPDAAGKTMLADELAQLLDGRGTAVVRASSDGFHRPRADRIARGELSPEGYLEDSFDLSALRRDLLEPLEPGGTRRIVRARYDWRGDAVVEGEVGTVETDAVLLLDGVFLQRSELAGCFEAAVFVFATPEVILERAHRRDRSALGGADGVERRYRARYMPGQALYFARERPHERADIALENSDTAVPLIDRTAVSAGVERWIAAWAP